MATKKKKNKTAYKRPTSDLEIIQTEGKQLGKKRKKMYPMQTEVKRKQ